MRLPSDPNLPNLPQGASDYARNVNFRLISLFRDIAAQVNAISEGTITGTTNAQSAAPTTGAWQRGDQVRNSAPSELGTDGSKYVVLGWICVAAGTPGTWKEMRCLTGS